MQKCHTLIIHTYNMKKLFTLSLSIFAFSFLSAQDITLNKAGYSIDTVQQFVVGPGCEYLQVRMTRTSDGGQPLDVYLLRVDVTNEYIHLEQVLANDKIASLERPTAMMSRKTTSTNVVVGGTNGDFFSNKLPLSTTICNSEFAYIGHPHYKIGLVDADGKPEIGDLMATKGATWLYSGKLVAGGRTDSIAHVNNTRQTNELVLYNHYQGTTTGTNNSGSEAVLSLLPGEQWTTSGTMKAKVESVRSGLGNTTISAGKFVLSGHGTMKSVIDGLKSGDEVEIVYSFLVNGAEMKASQCVGGHHTNLMVNNGVVVTENFFEDNHPRTGYGFTQDRNTVILCVVDGRRPGISEGCDSRALGAIMKHYGAWKALCWDGGGSSCMAINKFGQVNNPSDGSERTVVNGMFAVAKVPSDDQTITKIRCHIPELRLARGESFTPTFLGYNKYDILLDKALQGVKLSCDASLGTIQSDGSFVAGLTSGLLHATYGTNVTVDIPVEIEGSIPFAFTEGWNYSETSGKKASWTPDFGKLRNMAWGDGKLYVVNSVDGRIHVVNAQTGAYIQDLDMTDVSGGSLKVIDCHFVDGKLIACNLTETTSDPLKVYVWDNDNAAPRVLLETTDFGGFDRIGDAITVKDDNLTNGLLVFACTKDKKSSIVTYALNNGICSTSPTTVALTKDGAAVNLGPSPCAYYENGKWWAMGAVVNPGLYKTDGTHFETIPGSATCGSGGGSDFVHVHWKNKSYGFATTYQNDANRADGCVSVIAPNPGWREGTQLAILPQAGLGSTNNSSFSTSIATYNRGDESLEVWVLVHNQGIAYYKHGTVKTYDIPGNTTTLMEEVVSPVQILSTLGGVELFFEGTEQVAIYNVNGMLVAGGVANGYYACDLQAGMYVVRIGDKAYKFVK